MSPIFVIQKHDARRLHYDVRLEVDGVLKSWAVPRGPSPDPAQKRLAVPTDDHSLEYAEFEGVTGSGQYGSGAVIVWDFGEYRNLTEKSGTEVPIATALAQGHAKFSLHGVKLAGAWALTRTSANGDWLLVKVRDEYADPSWDPAESEPASVLSGRTIEEIAATK